MTLPVQPPLEPMLSAPEDDIPLGGGWLYEPKWDGFRALVYREGDEVHLGSRKQQPLERYFPELVEQLKRSVPERSVVDGEIIIAGEHSLDFNALLQRIHPAASRINKLAEATPASFVAFDLLALGDEDVRERPLTERRTLLEKTINGSDRVFLTPQTTDAVTARRWFNEYEGAGLDGLIAKRHDQPYRHGERVMVKVKHKRTADCVVGGYRVQKNGDGVGSLLLGLYDEKGVLHHVGHTSGFKAKERRAIRELLMPLEGGTSFGEGRTPGAVSRWSSGKDTAWIAVTPSLVCEVTFDHLQGDRFRHASTFQRWRTDRDPKSCTYAQLLPPHPFSIEKIARGNA
ncbi:MAG: ATP-dependent DNA ligase [Myxococcaceae bacterium]